jgi:hypothetical protein
MYAISEPGGNFASGEVEDSIPYFTKNLHKMQVFMKKIKMYHAAAGEVGFLSSQYMV